MAHFVCNQWFWTYFQRITHLLWIFKFTNSKSLLNFFNDFENKFINIAWFLDVQIKLKLHFNSFWSGMGKVRDGTVLRFFVPFPLVPIVPWLWISASVPIPGICGTEVVRNPGKTAHNWFWYWFLSFKPNLSTWGYSEISHFRWNKGKIAPERAVIQGQRQVLWLIRLTFKLTSDTVRPQDTYSIMPPTQNSNVLSLSSFQRI